MVLKRYLLLVLLAVAQFFTRSLFGQSIGGEVNIGEIPGNKNALFNKDTLINYSFNLKNTFKTTQEGKLTYLITTPHGKVVAKNGIEVKLEPQSSNIIQLNMPPQTTGFYKVNFMLNVTDYDDTVRRVFGVDVNNIKAETAAPTDFKQFWTDTKAELAKVAPNYKVIAQPGLSTGNDDIFEVQMQSLDNITVRAWLTLPKDRNPGDKLPLYILLPGYGAEMVPFRNVPHFACLTLDVRGLGKSRDVINPTRDQYISYHIEDKNKYIYRGALMDCERLLDFAASRADFDTTAVFVTGGSMGGYFALALAALDSRVTLCAAENPTFADYRFMAGGNEFPMADIEKYAAENKLKMDAVLNTLDYFDLKNFTPSVKCKTVFSIGLLDNFAPPTAEMAAYNLIGANKTLYVYPGLGHQVGPDLSAATGKWVYENLHIYDRIMGHSPINPEAPAQAAGSKMQVGNEIGFKDTPLSKDAIFKAGANVSYSIGISNSYNTFQAGTLSYQVITLDNKCLSNGSVTVNLPAHSVSSVKLDMPAQGSGFYKANFMLNVTDYDDTIRRVFGVDPGVIKSTTKKPDDFKDFWDNSIKELATVEPNYRVTKQPEMEQQNTDVYLVEMQSLDNVTVRGYLTIRKDRKAKEKFPVWILVPGYGLGGVKPIFGSTEVAVLSLNVRGEGNSRDRITPTRTGYLTTNIEDKKKYIYRGAIMDCIRAIDFVCSCKDLDSKSIIVAGGSMGGYLSIITASLDKRVKLCSANNPVFADYRSLPTDTWPMRDIKQYAADNSINVAAILNNLDYYDLKNFAPNLKCKTLLGISLLDDIAPPYNEYAMINNIPRKNKMFIYPNLGHEVPPALFSYLSVWMMDNMGLF